MSIQVQVDVSGATPELRTYPWIGENHGTIVLFSAAGVGTVLADKSVGAEEYGDDGAHGYEPGEHDENWSEDDFAAFEGTVTLSN